MLTQRFRRETEDAIRDQLTRLREPEIGFNVKVNPFNLKSLVGVAADQALDRTGLRKILWQRFGWSPRIGASISFTVTPYVTAKDHHDGTRYKVAEETSPLVLGSGDSVQIVGPWMIHVD